MKAFLKFCMDRSQKNQDGKIYDFSILKKRKSVEAINHELEKEKTNIKAFLDDLLEEFILPIINYEHEKKNYLHFASKIPIEIIKICHSSLQEYIKIKKQTAELSDLTDTEINLIVHNTLNNNHNWIALTDEHSYQNMLDNIYGAINHGTKEASRKIAGYNNITHDIWINNLEIAKKHFQEIISKKFSPTVFSEKQLNQIINDVSNALLPTKTLDSPIIRTLRILKTKIQLRLALIHK